MSIVRDLEAKSATVPVAGLQIALTYIALGDFNRAFVWLNQDCKRRVPLIRTVNAEPAYAPLRSDPRFAALIKCIGL
jgi:hypothetical protein